MPKGLLAHEIFRSSPKSNFSNSPTTPFDANEQKQNIILSSSTKKTLAPLPPMKKFGGYKPKILGGEIGNGVVPVTHSTPNNNTSFVSSSEQESAAVKRRQAPGIPRPKLTNPEPFIIGDKDSPMVLSTSNDFEDDRRDESNLTIDDMHIYAGPEIKSNRESVEFNNNIDNNNNNNNNNNNHHHHAPISSSSYSFQTGQSDNSQNDTSSHDQIEFTLPHDKNQLITRNEHDVHDTYATENPVFYKGESVENIPNGVSITKPSTDSEPEDVFIPFPDYDEEERTMEFTDEDPVELAEEENHKQQQQQQYHNHQRQHKENQQNGLVLFYEGEDLSKYLNDDDDEVVYSGSKTPTPLNQKHNLFKQRPQNGTDKRRLSGQNKSLGQSSVRNFSLADSKYGTAGKAGSKKNLSSDISPDFESFLNTSQRGDNYETFLRSKHGVALDVTRGGEIGYRGKGNDGIWKKFTVRLKHKLQKNGYDMNAN